MCKFRISAHDLEIEKGRYYKVDVDKRIFKLCNIEVEDEIHFLLKCPKLRDKRTDILNKIYSKYNNLSSLNTREVFIWLMSSEDPFILRNISKLLIVLFAEKSVLLQHDTVP